jgi:hypothetical protein
VSDAGQPVGLVNDRITVTALEIYSALIDRIWAAGLVVHVNAPVGGEQEAGSFDGRRMVIDIYRARGGIRGRDRVIETVQDPLEEAITLAHEFGHYESFTAGVAPDYPAARDLFGVEQAAVPVPASRLTATQKQLVLGEEQMAWTNGRAVLAAFGFNDWQAFDTRERDGLAEYRRRLEAGATSTLANETGT